MEDDLCYNKMKGPKNTMLQSPSTLTITAVWFCRPTIVYNYTGSKNFKTLDWEGVSAEPGNKISELMDLVEKQFSIISECILSNVLIFFILVIFWCKKGVWSMSTEWQPGISSSILCCCKYWKTVRKHEKKILLKC